MVQLQNLRIPSSVLVLDALLRALVLVSAEAPRFKPLRCVWRGLVCSLEEYGMPGFCFNKKEEVLFGAGFLLVEVSFSCERKKKVYWILGCFGRCFGDDPIGKQHWKLREHHRNNV